MRVTVCELRNDPAGLEEDWAGLAEHVKSEGSNLVLLPEMPFFRWLAADREVSAAVWADAVRAHQDWVGRLPELGASTVLWTGPVVENDQRFNEAAVWTRDDATVRPAHRKRYLPNEAGFWEASWYERGDGSFDPLDTPGGRLGFMICTEIWFQQHARAYGQQGVQLIASPRATLESSADKWLAGGRSCAVVSGAYSLSSNFSGSAGAHGEWAGLGWIVEPEEGEVLGTTSRAEPFLTREIALEVADTAKTTYPRYVED
ncbi:MAG: carbon-nitrogen hydrolase family protein [Acidobacteriota bacterium]